MYSGFAFTGSEKKFRKMNVHAAALLCLLFLESWLLSKFCCLKWCYLLIDAYLHKNSEKVWTEPPRSFERQTLLSSPWKKSYLVPIFCRLQQKQVAKVKVPKKPILCIFSTHSGEVWISSKSEVQVLWKFGNSSMKRFTSVQKYGYPTNFWTMFLLSAGPCWDERDD